MHDAQAGRWIEDGVHRTLTMRARVAANFDLLQSSPLDVRHTDNIAR
jgi:hypothetical protein